MYELTTVYSSISQLRRLQVPNRTSMWLSRDAAAETRWNGVGTFPTMASSFLLQPMPATARSNTVRAAAQVLGPDALAETLGVSRLQVERWVSGEESVPTEIFLRAVDLLEQNDRRKSPRPPGNDTQPGQG